MRKIISMLLILSLVSGCERISRTIVDKEITVLPQVKSHETILGKYLGKYKDNYELVINAGKELAPTIFVISAAISLGAVIMYAPYKLYRWFKPEVPSGGKKELINLVKNIKDDLNKNIKTALIFLNNNIVNCAKEIEIEIVRGTRHLLMSTLGTQEEQEEAKVRNLENLKNFVQKKINTAFSYRDGQDNLAFLENKDSPDLDIPSPPPPENPPEI
jgi:hypothetical protein